MSDSFQAARPRWGGKEALKKRIIRFYSSALVAGRPHLRYLTKLGFDSDKCELGYDVVDNDYFSGPILDSRNDLNLPANYFLVSARFISEKNLLHLLRAYASYRQLAQSNNTAPWKLTLMGDGPLRGKLLAEISRLHLDQFVFLPGFKQYGEVRGYYRMARALILPSVSETWGLVVNEAMASGLPVLVSSRCGCASDLVQKGMNGFTFDPFNLEELGNLMLRLTQMSDDQLASMGSASKRIIADWGPSLFASGLRGAVDKALVTGPKDATFFDRAMIRMLIGRPGA